MNLEDIKQILDLVREHDLAVAFVAPVGPVAAPLVAAAPAVAGAPALAAGTPDESEPVNLAVIKSPIVGTFYRSADPAAPAFVEVGQMVTKGQVLCIIEAMKLMNEIESDCDGEVAAVYVENGKPVQFGERLFAVKVG
jgi:acetyl-CoA carboxylase biotin carboxyl carrier protein